MNDKNMLSFYGLKWNPFLPDIPNEALWSPPAVENFIYRLEGLAMNGGFAMICGEPGIGKSKTLQFLSHRFSRHDEVIVGAMERPQSSLSDFYREMGSLFGVNLSPANRYGGFKDLRERWRNHIESTLFRPLLFIDESQEMLTCCLNELRLLGSFHFDSRNLLTIVLCGDMRLPDRFRSNALVSLGSRIRFRMNLEPYNRNDLINYMAHCLKEGGAPHIMTKALVEALVDHCAGNLRVLNNMAAELLAVGTHNQVSQLDEKFFIEVFSRNPSKPSK